MCSKPVNSKTKLAYIMSGLDSNPLRASKTVGHKIFIVKAKCVNSEMSRGYIQLCGAELTCNPTSSIYATEGKRRVWKTMCNVSSRKSHGTEESNCIQQQTGF